MNAAPVLDYLDALLGDPVPVPVSAPVPVPSAGAEVGGREVARTVAGDPAPSSLRTTPAMPAAPPPPASAPAPAAVARTTPPAAPLHPLLAPAPAAPAAAPVAPSVRWLRLRCGAQAYALELLKVQEVVLPTAPLPLRGTSASMLGVMNLRGQVVPLLDLGRHLGGAPVTMNAAARIVVLEAHGERLGLLVSAVEDVTSLHPHQIESPDHARPGRLADDLFRGIARQGQQPLILLDASVLLGAS